MERERDCDFQYSLNLVDRREGNFLADGAQEERKEKMNNKKQEARAEGLRKGIKRNKRISKPGGVKGKEEKDKKKKR